MIAFEGDVKLTDFGIAKARGFLVDNEGEVVAGKADYMSPEQADFQITDQRSDLFSAGVVLAHLLLGKNIFKGATAGGIPPAHDQPAHPGFPLAGYARGRPAERDPPPRAGRATLSQRYQSGDELLYDLEHYIYHSGYGPTNETLGKFIRELFGQAVPPAATQAVTGSTKHLKRTTRHRPRVERHASAEAPARIMHDPSQHE